MADMCFNQLDVWGGTPELRAEMREAAAGMGDDGQAAPLVFGRAFPNPRSIDGDGDAVVEWRARNWGVKWEAEDPEVEDLGNKLRYRFLTAYAGPLYWCEAMSALFPQLTFRIAYSCPEAVVTGTMTFRTGVPIHAAFIDPRTPGVASDEGWRAASRALLASVDAVSVIDDAGLAGG